MKRRRWDSKTKTKIVLEGLYGRPVSEICNEYGIHQNQYYIWRDKFLSEAHRAFESKKDGAEVNRLRKRNQELKQIIVSLTVELKKNRGRRYMRTQSDSVAVRNQYILKRIKSIKANHPFWGYRRVWAYLRYIDGLIVNKKRVYRLMRENNLTVKPNPRRIAKRVYERQKPRPDRPKQWWGIDMIKVISNTGWVYVVIVLDWYTKKIVGHYSGKQARTAEWLEALEKGLNREFHGGVRGHGLKLMSDNGSQPTSLSFMKACSTLEVEQAFTSYNNPKGNADTERMIRTMKEELLWLREWENEIELSHQLGKWIEYYNRIYPHSALGYRTPIQAQEDYRKKREDTLLNAA